MRALRSPSSAIPRGFPDHRRVDARKYRAYCLAVLEHLGALPSVASGTLREAGRAFVELEHLGHDLQAARERRRRKDMARIRRAQFALRE